MIAYLYATGEDAFDISGTRIDFTERTFIWQYALAHFDERPILGFGINGFWTNGDFYQAFERSHGWVLDDFHSGYVAILTETGLVGYAAFAVCTLLFGVRLAASIEEGTMARSRVVALIGFMTLIYMIDLTETIFLRSTSFMSTLIPAFLVNSAMPTAGPEASS
jgi:exopolysaccharide production protein ExoQ